MARDRTAEETPFSVKIIGTIIEAWKVGKVALALMVIGTISILAAFGLAVRGPAAYDIALAFLALGALLIGSVAYMFIIEAVLPTRRAMKVLRQNAILLDAVQDLSIQLTDIITELNDFAISNASEIVSGIEQIKGLMHIVPGASRLLETKYFEKSRAFTLKIQDVAHQSREVIREVRDALAKADMTRLASYVASLKNTRQMIRAQLRVGD